MAFTTVTENTWGFSEITGGAGGDRQPLIKNTTTRKYDPFEVVMQATFPFYCGEIREYDGVTAAASGRASIDHNRVIRTKQILVGSTFVVGAKVFFKPGGNAAAGQIVDAANKAAGSIEYGICEGFGGVATAHTYIDVRPLAYTENRVLEV